MVKKRQTNIIKLLVALFVVVFGGILFVGAVSGWFNRTKVKIDSEYYVDSPSFMEISGEEYGGLVNEKKSFLLFVDQNGCDVADRLRNYISDYAQEKGISVYRMMFQDLKNTSLYEKVKYYPSVVIFDRGRVKDFLEADNDEDAEMYSDYSAFVNWLKNRVE